MYRVPANLWWIELTHPSKLRMKRLHLIEKGNSRTAWKVVTGDTPDILEFLYFHFYQPVLTSMTTQLLSLLTAKTRSRDDWLAKGQTLHRISVTA